MSGEIVMRDYTDADLDAVLRCFHRSVHGVASRHYTDASPRDRCSKRPDFRSAASIP